MAASVGTAVGMAQGVGRLRVSSRPQPTKREEGEKQPVGGIGEAFLRGINVPQDDHGRYFLTTEAYEVVVTAEPGAWVGMAGGLPMQTDTAGKVSLTIPFREGLNPLPIAIENPSGKVEEQVIAIHVDAVSPEIDWLNLHDGDIYNAFSLVVQGKTEREALIQVDTQIDRVWGYADHAGNFSLEVLLAEGENPITFTVKDDTHQVERTYHVECDGAAPELFWINLPQSDLGSYDVDGSWFDFAGQTVPGATVAINDQFPVIADQEGYFYQSFMFMEGRNELSVKITDREGNQAIQTLPVMENGEEQY